MWWCVKQVSPKEVHVYPVQEQHHLLRADLCNCSPEVRYGGGAKMIVHRKVIRIRAPLKPAFPAHWVTAPIRITCVTR